MKFMVQFQLKPGVKQKAVQAFELRGPSRNQGVTFVNAWIGNQSDMVYVLAESAEESLVAKVAEGWSEYGTYRIESVIGVEEF
jgi:hypothetical protein